MSKFPKMIIALFTIFSSLNIYCSSSASRSVPPTPNTRDISKIFKGEECIHDSSGKKYTLEEFKSWLLGTEDIIDPSDNSLGGLVSRKMEVLTKKFPQLKKTQANGLINGPFLAFISNNNSATTSH